MADLSKPIGTLAAIDIEQVKAYKQWDSVGISMSALDTNCDRALWYLLRWASEPEKMTGGKLDRFETGNIWEERLLNQIALIPNAIVWKTDTNTGKQFKVYMLGGHVRGKLDGEAVGLPEMPFETVCVECKSHKQESFNALVKHGVKKFKPAHWWQCQFYMHKREREFCLYIAVNKNDETKKYIEFIKYDARSIELMGRRLEKVINAVEAPSKISEDQSKFPCTFCNHNDVCSHQAFGRRNCRTCIFSTPVIDKESNDATWLCEHTSHKKALSLDDQRAGCEDHLYLPAMVPGKQIDVNGESVTYLMGDGTEWVNAKE